MTIDELAQALGGEVVGNQARVRREGGWRVLGTIEGQDWQLTELGQRLMEAAQTPTIDDLLPAAPVRRTRTRKVTAADPE